MHFAGATVDLKRVIITEPNVSIAHCSLGDALKNEHTGEPSRTGPDDAPAHYNLGVALRSQGDHTGAAATYSGAIVTEPNGASAHYKRRLACFGCACKVALAVKCMAKVTVRMCG